MTTIAGALIPTTTTTSTTTSSTCTCAACTQPALERVRYFPRQLLTVDDMVADQNYFREKLRRHNRYLHGTGVVCGLWVTAAPASGAPWQVAVSAGYAIGPFGDEIYVADTVNLDLARCAAGDTTDPCDPTVYNPATSGITRELYVAIQYSECFAKPVRSMAAGCGCGDTGCEYSRIRDSFELGCVATFAPPTVPLLCALRSAHAVVPCPAAPANPWVVLARVILPASSESALTSKSIDNAVRVPLYSTALIQQQVISCCCGPQTAPVPVQVTSVTPANNALLNSSPAQVLVTFNKPLQPATVNTSTLLVQLGGKSLDGQVAYNASTNAATYTPKDGFPLGVLTVTAVGAGASPITDTDSLALDGIGNGQPGSNHVTTFTIEEERIQ